MRADEELQQQSDDLTKYNQIFKIPIGLPLRRGHDHRIPLVPEVSPVAVRPYRYPHFRQERERNKWSS